MNYKKIRSALQLFFILVIYSLFHVTDSFSQNRQINWGETLIKDKIYYQKDSAETIYYLGFENAAYLNPDNRLPYYSEQIALKKNERIAGIKIQNTKWEKVDWVKLSYIRGLQELPSDTKVEYVYETGRNVSSANLRFIPLRRNPQTGSIEKLTRFTLDVSKISGAVTKLKSTTSALKTNSVLASGSWLRFKVYKDGIYKITYQDLVDMGIEDVSKVQVFGNQGGQLPYDVSDPRIDDLEEIPVMQQFGDDGTFGPGDYFCFYLKGPHQWKFDGNRHVFERQINDYSNHSAYFLTWGKSQPKLIKEANIPSASPEHTITTFIDYGHHEAELENPLESGRLWLGERFSGSAVWDTTFVFKNIDLTKKAYVSASVVGRDDASSSFEVSSNGEVIRSVSISPVNTGSHSSYWADDGIIREFFDPSGESLPLRVKYNRQTADAQGWLDYITVNAYRHLIKVANEPLYFRYNKEIDQGSTVSYEIKNATSSDIIWDITDMHDVKQVKGTINNGTLKFRANADIIRQYVMFKEDEVILRPEFEESLVPNQNLHAAPPVDYVIITYPDFLDQANELAQLHRDKSGLEVLVVTPQQVYNEFSGGTPDATAYRDFMRFLYLKYGTDHPNSLKYLLLFGDGSYNNRSTPGEEGNFILTYQSQGTFLQTSSFVADDFFTFLDEGEGDDNNGLMDIGVGRFPVNNTTQAQQMVDKVRAYMNSEGMLPWRNRLTFVGDDEDNNLHMDQADQLTKKIDASHPEFVLQKIYMDAYKQQSSASGDAYPDVTRAINDAIQTGTLIFNYTGHGGTRGLAHERIVGKNEIQDWYNLRHYPLFITATCEFSRFDMPGQTTAGELVLLNPKGGAIGLLSTTRLVYSRPNFDLNLMFFDYAFECDENGEKYRFGDVLRLSKNAVSDKRNKRNFTLLGDPALQLNFPRHEVITDSINHVSIENLTDTVSAFSEVTVSGHVADANGNVFTGFNGTVYPAVFDKIRTIQTMNNDSEGVYTFKTRQNAIYKGKASVQNGRFEFSFLVPKDIAYNIGTGKIVYYAQDSTIDAHGYFDSLMIGGPPKVTIVDDEGPDIRLFMNDTLFVSGGITGTNPVLLAKISDHSGINTSGSGIGHDLVAYFDGKSSDPIILNDYFEAEKDNFGLGQLAYPFTGLTPGKHTLHLKVWDINNNSSTATIEFIVEPGNQLQIEKLSNNPNPVRTSGTYFVFEHNQSNTALDITIDIIDLSGRIVKTIHQNNFSGGYRVADIYWDGTTEQGVPLSRGIYLYRLRLETENGLTSEKIQRLLIL
ncbi:MAG: type IX secretion system sortase PorU [Bacteroidota bacterium]